MTDANPTYAALLADVLAAPADDAPRLLLADWLEEYGGQPERAEFIRVQVEMARLESSGLFAQPTRRYDSSGRWLAWGINPDYDRLGVREMELISAHGFYWFRNEMPGIIDHATLTRKGSAFLTAERGEPTGPWNDCLYRRGFIASVECRCEDWLQHGPAVVACQPVERVRLTDREPSVNAYGGDRVAWQSSSSDDDLSSWVPYHLLKLMSAIVGEDLDGQTWLVFDNQQVALDALSTACLLWARQQAGLATTNA